MKSMSNPNPNSSLINLIICIRQLWPTGHVERLIGSIRRESLDHLVVFDEAHLRRVLKNYASYYNQVRTHLSLDKNAPEFRRPQRHGSSQPSQFWVDCITNMPGFEI